MPNRNTQFRMLLATAVAMVSLVCGGCLLHRTTQAAAPVSAPPQPEAERPMTVAPDTDALPPQPSATSPPSVSANADETPLDSLPQSKMTVPPPKPPSDQTSTERAAEATVPAPAPQIVPQLSQADQQNYQRKMNDDVTVAEQNLQRANGRNLNATQQDMLENIRSFLAESRDASKNGDWVRAQSLSQKARSLSVELVNSL